MDWTTPQTFLLVTYCISILAAMFLNRIIWKYLNKKPLGMQTLIDPMIKDLIALGFGALLTSTEPIFGLGLPLQDHVALALIFAQILASNAWFIQNIALVTTRYLSVFHPALMNSITFSDARFVKIIRTANAGLSLSFLLYEVSVQDFRQGMVFKFLTGTPESTGKLLQPPTIKMLLVANLLVMTIAQLKIVDYRAREKSQGGPYSLKTLQAVTFIAVMMIFIMLARVLGFALYDYTRVVQQQVYHILGSVALLNVLPAVFIWKNKNMKAFALKQTKMDLKFLK